MQTFQLRPSHPSDNRSYRPRTTIEHSIIQCYTSRIQTVKPTVRRPRSPNDDIPIPCASNNHTNSFAKSTLSRLPPELRHQIYTYVLGEEHAVHLQPLTPTKFRILTRSPHAYHFGLYTAALLLTCRQVHAEAVHLLYQKAVFIVTGDLAVLLMFKELVGPRQFDMIRHLRISLDRPSRRNLRLPASMRAPCVCSASEWRRLWSAIAGMRGLWTLSVSIGYRFGKMRDQYRSLRSVLEPLLGFSGLREFQLDFRLRSVLNSGGRVEVCEGILELIERIKMTALQPRIVR
ncbi:MAG: hypothetical protein Q9192_001768 [Flavoplaca navasiana]